MSAEILAAAVDYVHTRDRHQSHGPLLSDVRATHERLVAAVHAARELFGDQTCPACGLEHPGRVCDVPSLLEEL